MCITWLCGVTAPDGYHYSLLMLYSWYRNTFCSASPSSHTPKYQAYSTALRALQWIFILYVAISCCTSHEVAQLFKFMTNLYAQLHIAVPWTCKHASMFGAHGKRSFSLISLILNKQPSALTTSSASSSVCIYSKESKAKIVVLLKKKYNHTFRALHRTGVRYTLLILERIVWL